MKKDAAKLFVENSPPTTTEKPPEKVSNVELDSETRPDEQATTAPTIAMEPNPQEQVEIPKPPPVYTHLEVGQKITGVVDSISTMGAMIQIRDNPDAYLPLTPRTAEKLSMSDKIENLTVVSLIADSPTVLALPGDFATYDAHDEPISEASSTTEEKTVSNTAPFEAPALTGKTMRTTIHPQPIKCGICEQFVIETIVKEEIQEFDNEVYPWLICTKLECRKNRKNKLADHQQEVESHDKFYDEQEEKEARENAKEPSLEKPAEKEKKRLIVIGVDEESGMFITEEEEDDVPIVSGVNLPPRCVTRAEEEAENNAQRQRTETIDRMSIPNEDIFEEWRRVPQENRPRDMLKFPVPRT